MPIRPPGATVRAVSGTEPGAAELLRDIGLMADGPVRWGAPVQSRRAGLYVVELGEPLATAPIEMTRVGKWLERLPALRLDGERPTSKALAARLSAFWWPESTVLYAGFTNRSVGGKAASLMAHAPGDRQPHPDGQWLHLLRPLDRLGARIWWAETDAQEEYFDALLDAFGAGRATATGRAQAAGRPAGALALPWANMRRPTGEWQVHGITGAFVPESPRTPVPPRRVVEVAPGDADGARAEGRGTGMARRAPVAARSTAGPRARPAATRPCGPARQAAASRKAQHAGPEPIQISRGALERVTAELDQLTQVKRREVVARIKAAREHGDLKENSEYQAAREEQSFLEGRVQALEDRIRRAVVVDEIATGRVMMGSTVTVEVGGEEVRYTIVGSTESDPTKGRLSTASPVGAALLGAVAGSEVDIRTPRGSVRYRVVSVD